MRIVIDARYLTRQYSGIRMYSERLLEHLALQDHENEYFCLVQPDYTRPLALGENFQLVKYEARPLSLNTIFSLHKTVNSLKPDFFHILFPLMPVFFKGKLLVTVYDLQPLMMKDWTGRRFFPVKKMYDMFYHWIYPHTFRKAMWLVAVSQATKDAISHFFPELTEKTIVVHPGIDLESVDLQNPSVFEGLKVKYDIPDQYILYVGSTRPNKNLPNMLRAYARVREIAPQFQGLGFVLVLTRDRFIAEVLQVIKEKNLAPGIRILDPVSQAEKHALYDYARLFFFATRLEGFGFPLLEAQAQGTPVVASNDHSLPEIAQDSAVLVDPDDVEALADALKEVLGNRNLREDLIKKGKRNVKNFSWEKTAHRILEIYRHLM